MTEVWLPPSMLASAVLQLAQDQWRAAHCVPPQRDPPGREFPGVVGQAPAEAKANPILSDGAAPAARVLLVCWKRWPI